MRKKICLALLLLAVGRGPAAADSEPPDLPEPPPAPLIEAEPAPAVVTPPAVKADSGPRSPALPALARAAAEPGRASRNAAWGGAAVTFALITVGTVFGVLAQQRSDALSLSTASVGLPPIYDAAQHLAYTELQSQGQTYNNAAAACFYASGATALASAVLFWNAARVKSRDKQLAVVPVVSPRGGTLAVSGSF